MEIIEILEAVYMDSQNSAIKLVVRYSDNVNETEGLVIRGDDPATSSLYQNTVNGEYGVVQDYVDPGPEPVSVPDSVTKGQALRELIRNGVFPDAIETAIDGIADTTQRELTRSYFRDETRYYRNHPAMVYLGGLLEFTPEQMDQLFISADATT